MIDPALPLIDLHRHLDGNVRLETILALGLEHRLPLPAWDLEALRPHVQVSTLPTEPASAPGVMAFIARFRWMTEAMVDYAACRRIAWENVEDARREGLDYVELRFSPWFMAEVHGLDPVGVVEAVVDGIKSGQDAFCVRTNLIGILSRTYGPEVGWQELDALLTQRDSIVALDLAGDEANVPGHLFTEHFRRARDVGWQITVHAGESNGPHSIWQAIHGLGAARLGHAVTAIHDPALLDYLAEHQVAIECNLTSNVQTSTVAGYASHPARRFLQRGLLVTLNTDDPGISAIDLRHEYDVAAPAAGLSVDDARQAQHNALAASFLSPVEKEALAAAARQRSSQPSAELAKLRFRPLQARIATQSSSAQETSS